MSLAKEIKDVKGNNSFGYSTGWFPEERGNPSLGISNAAAFSKGNIEVSVLGYSELSPLVGFLDDPKNVEVLASFEGVSLHSSTKELETDNDWLEMINSISKISDNFERIIFHPEIIPVHNQQVVDALRNLGLSLTFENMDIRRKEYKTVEDMQRIFDLFPRAGFCLDVAHVWTVDPSLKLGKDLISAFNDRLVEVHLSGIHADGRHMETTANDLTKYKPLLNLLKDKPWVFESVYTSPEKMNKNLKV